MVKKKIQMCLSIRNLFLHHLRMRLILDNKVTTLPPDPGNREQGAWEGLGSDGSCYSGAPLWSPPDTFCHP